MKVLLFAALITVMVFGTVQAQNQKPGTGYHPPEHMQLHDEFYASWKMPEPRDRATGQRQNNCCGGRDCYPTAIKKVTYGKWGEQSGWYAMHRETGKWVIIPDEKLEHNTHDPRESPDGQSHVCASPLGNIFCAVVGSGQ